MEQLKLWIAALVTALSACGGGGGTSAPSPAGVQVAPSAPDIYILAGQSNMSGRGDLATAPAPRYGSNVLVYTNAGRWEQAAHPLDSDASQIDPVSADSNARVGPGLSFGERMHELSGRKVALVPCAKGDTTLDQWAFNLDRTSLYGSCAARTREAVRSTGGLLKGVLWYQGESDATVALAPGWSAKLSAWIDALRMDLVSVPVVITELGPNPNDPRFPEWGQIQAQQRAFTGVNVAVVSAADLTPLAPGNPHIDTASQQVLGVRYAESMWSLR